jgi:hypothetical protein
VCPCQATSRRKKTPRPFPVLQRIIQQQIGIQGYIVYILIYGKFWRTCAKTQHPFDIHTIEIIILHVLTTIANIDMIVSVANENDL